MKFPHTITRASAGTGKTFQLSNRYLELVHRGEGPDRILATTFARKAAGEIMDRILIRLAEAATDDKKRQELGKFVGETDLSAERCCQLLRSLTSQLHRLRVGTIDSFFAQIARAFALELGISPAWQIIDELDDARLRDEAIEAVLTNSQRPDLLRLVHLLTKGEARRGISQLLRDTVDSLYQIFLDTEKEAWHQLPRYKELSADELDNTLDELEALPLSSGALVKGRNDDLRRASEGNWDEFIKLGIAGKLVGGASAYNRQEVPPDARALYDRLIEHAKAILIGKAVNRTEGAFQWLEKYHAEYQQLKSQQRAMQFDDVTRAVGRIAADGSVQRLALRLDAHIDHLLLDEFQDTSPAQWHAVRPFAKQVTSGGNKSFYCVGDTKQAIYGWRGGVAEIFDAVAGELSVDSGQPLSTSYRSSPVIIETVNRIFTQLTNHPKLDRAENAVVAWQKRFPKHETAKKKYNGYACLRTGPLVEGRKKEQDAALLQWTAGYVEQLAKEAPGCSVGVLLRTNQALGRLIFSLRQRGVAASEEGGNPLTDSAAVQLLMSLMKLADHPGDKIARFHLANSPLADELGSVDIDTPAALRISNDLRRSLIEDGYGPTIYKWTRLLAPACNRRELSRLNQLVELAYGFGPKATLRTRDFVRFVENQRVADPLPADVRVMTVHKAKGLEFDIVVLPELGAGLTGQSPAFVVNRPNPTGPADCVVQYVNANVQQLLPQRFQAMFAESTRREVTEELCVLYVAVTRAAHALHLIVPPSGKETTFPRTVAGLLRASLKDTSRIEAESVVWETGDRQWFRSPGDDTEYEEKSVIAGATTSQPIEVRLAAGRGRVREMERVAPSRVHLGPRIKATDIFAQQDNTPAKLRGTIIHAWFEQIEWLDEWPDGGPPDEDSLRREAALHSLAGLNIDNLLAEFHKMLGRGDTPRVLSRKYYDRGENLPLSNAVREQLAGAKVTLTVRREYAFAYRSDEAQLCEGMIDRLVLLHRDDQLIAADIIDYKTDVDIAAAAEKHTSQLQAYRLAVSRQFNLPPECIAARLLMVKDGSLISIE